MPLYYIDKTIKSNGRYHYPSDNPVQLPELNQKWIKKGFVRPGGVAAEIKTSSPKPSHSQTSTGSQTSQASSQTPEESGEETVSGGSSSSKSKEKSKK